VNADGDVEIAAGSLEFTAKTRGIRVESGAKSSDERIHAYFRSQDTDSVLVEQAWKIASGRADHGSMRLHRI
jgi:hypothetical protein